VTVAAREKWLILNACFSGLEGTWWLIAVDVVESDFRSSAVEVGGSIRLFSFERGTLKRQAPVVCADRHGVKKKLEWEFQSGFAVGVSQSF
jgi:hypothetical protein